MGNFDKDVRGGVISGIDTVLEEEIGGIAPSIFWGVLLGGSAAGTYYLSESKHRMLWVGILAAGAAWFLIVKPILHVIGSSRRKKREHLRRLVGRVERGSPRPNWASEEMWDEAHRLAGVEETPSAR